MARWEGKSKGTTTGYRIFVFLIKTAGTRAAYMLLRLVAFYYFLFSIESSRHILSFYRNILTFNRTKSYRYLYLNYYRFGQVLIDKIALLAGARTNFTFEFDGEEHLRKMIESKQGGLLISRHVGNWEAAGHLLKRLNTTIHIVMYDGEDIQIKNYLDSVTGPKHFNIISVKDDLSHLFYINEALRSGGLVCIHADRFRPGNKTLQTLFMGRAATFPEGPFRLALKLKCPVAFVYAFKESNRHYHLYSSLLKMYNIDSGDSADAILREFAEGLEDMVRKYPEQWFNYYDFWA